MQRHLGPSPECVTHLLSSTSRKGLCWRSQKETLSSNIGINASPTRASNVYFANSSSYHRGSPLRYSLIYTSEQRYGLQQVLIWRRRPQALSKGRRWIGLVWTLLSIAMGWREARSVKLTMKLQTRTLQAVEMTRWQQNSALKADSGISKVLSSGQRFQCWELTCVELTQNYLVTAFS